MGLSVKIPQSSSKAEEGELLSPVAFHFSQPHVNSHIILTLGLGKIVTAENIKDGLEVTLLQHPRFSSIQVAEKKTWRTKLRWVPTKVNLDEHIIFSDPASAAEAAAGDSTAGDVYVEKYTSDLHHSLLDSSRPLWDLHILPIRTTEAACVVIFRLHHSLGDGISLMSLLHAITRRSSHPDSLPSLPKARRRSASADDARYGRFLLFLCWMWSFFVYAWNTFAEIILLSFSSVFLKDTETPIMRKEGRASRLKLLFAHRTLLLDDINAIKNTVGCTINDVLVGVISAALFRYLSRYYGGQPPKHMRISSSVAVNIRPLSGIHSLADMMKKDSEVPWGNRVGYFSLRLPVMKCEDPMDYVRKGAAIAEKKKKSFIAMFNYISGVWIYKILGVKIATSLLREVFSHITFLFSNFVGPIEEVDFCGSPLVYIAPSTYGYQPPTTIHIQSYVNKMKIVLAVDEKAISDPHKLLDDIADSLQIIKDAATSSNYKATKIE